MAWGSPFAGGAKCLVSAYTGAGLLDAMSLGPMWSGEMAAGDTQTFPDAQTADTMTLIVSADGTVELRSSGTIGPGSMRYFCVLVQPDVSPGSMQSDNLLSPADAAGDALYSTVVSPSGADIQIFALTPVAPPGFWTPYTSFGNGGEVVVGMDVSWS